MGATIAAPGSDDQAEQGVLFKISKLTAPEGETIRVPIAIDDAQGAVAFDLWLRFDPTVLRPVLVELGQAASSFTLTPNLEDEGLARIGLFNAYSFQGSGEIAVITFQVIGRVGDLTPLALTAAVDEGRIPSIVKEGRVRVRPGR